jgi:hypothetical protein
MKRKPAHRARGSPLRRRPGNSIVMNSFPPHDPQSFVREFNEEEAVWRCFEQKRAVRRLLDSDSLLPEDILDHLDWLAAEREMRVTRAIGRWVDAPSR